MTRDIQTVTDFIDASPGQARTTRDLAKRVGLTTISLQRRFREQMGISPHDYLLARKVEHAARLLRETDTSVTAIAHELAFSSSQYFARVFKSYMGQSPTECRRRLDPDLTYAPEVVVRLTGN